MKQQLDTMPIPKKQLSDDEYDRYRLKHLEKLKRKEGLNKKLRKEYDYLKGNRKTRDRDFTSHRTARSRIHYLSQFMSLEDIAATSGQFSLKAVKDLYTGHYHHMSTGYASSIMYNLKKVIEDIETQTEENKNLKR